LVAVDPLRRVAIDHGTAPVGARSSPKATQRAASRADSNRRWLSIRKSVSGAPEVIRLCWAELVEVPTRRPSWTFQVPPTTVRPDGGLAPSNFSSTVGASAVWASAIWGAAGANGSASAALGVISAVKVAPATRAVSTARGRRVVSFMVTERRKPPLTPAKLVMN